MNEGVLHLPGIIVSGILLMLLGGLFGCYVPLFGLLLSVTVIKAHGMHQLLAAKPSLLIIVLTILSAGGLCYICVRAGLAILSAKKWAAFVAMGLGLLLLLVGWDCLRYVYLPYAPGVVHGEDVSAFLMAIPCIGVGLWWCVYLNLPHVRRHLGKAVVARTSPSASGGTYE